MRLPLRKKLLYALPATVLVVAGALSLGAQHYVFPSEADPTEWKPAADYVRKKIGPDDRIRTHPPWNIDGLPHLEELGDRVDRRHDPLAEDLYGADRIWVLAETAQLEEAIRRIPFEGAETSIRRFGDVSVVRATVPQESRFEWEALENLSDARVERVEEKKDGSTSVRHCKKWNESERRWDCGGRDAWLYVGEVFKYLGRDAHRAIWAHPLPGDKRLRISFSDVPLGDLLRVRAGFTFMASRRDRGRPVTLEVRLDGETRARRTYPILESSWKPIDIDTSERAGASGELTLVVTSPKIRDRFFCLNAWTRP